LLVIIVTNLDTKFTNKKIIGYRNSHCY